MQAMSVPTSTWGVLMKRNLKDNNTYLTKYKAYANNIGMNGGLSITERLNQPGNTPLPPAPVEQMPPVVPIAPEAPETRWKMEGDLFGDEAGHAEVAPVAPKTVASIGNLAARTADINLNDAAILPPESPTQLPKRVDKYLRTEGVGPGVALTAEQRAARQRDTDNYFGYTNQPNVVGTPRPASTHIPATQMSGSSRRSGISAEAIAADDEYFARLNGAA